MDFFRKQTNKRAVTVYDPIPVGEAQESDWSEWEDSVAFQDSQTEGFAETTRMALMPEDTFSVDAFSSVSKNSA